jgi:hypothetical protein
MVFSISLRDFWDYTCKSNYLHATNEVFGQNKLQNAQTLHGDEKSRPGDPGGS